MKKMFYFLVALISCVLVFNSCKKNNSKECHILDGYTYQDDDGMMTYAFSDGKCKWTMYSEYLENTSSVANLTSVQTYPYKVNGSQLYIGLDFPEYDMPIEENAVITGTVSDDLKSIEMLHKGVGISSFTVYRTN